MFIAITMNHIRAAKAWGEAHDAQVNLNLLNFELEVRASNRYFTLYPQFLAKHDGRLMHVPVLTPETTGFIGWLPYRPLSWSLAADKLVFKQRLSLAGLSTPAMWAHPSAASADFVVKNSVGSFGKEVAGPYRPGSQFDLKLVQSTPQSGSAGKVFAESFVNGTNLKVWFWGDHPFHAQVQAYPRISGNGTHTLAQLIEVRLVEIGATWASYPEQLAVEQALAYQGLNLTSVMQIGEAVWLDFRYGRRFGPDASSEVEDNAWPVVAPALRQQIVQAGRWLGRELLAELGAPVLASLDGVVDNEGKVWWLEANSNPVFPPTGYTVMLATLFALSTRPREAQPQVFPPTDGARIEQQTMSAPVRSQLVLHAEAATSFNLAQRAPA